MFRCAGSSRLAFACMVTVVILALAAPPAMADTYLDVIISELMYHAPGVDAEGEYVEITNRGSQTVDLTGWRLADGIEYPFPGGTTIAPGEYLVIAKDPSAAAAIYSITGVLGPYDGRLDNGGERVEVRNDDDGLVCEVWYDDETAWPTGGDDDGRSIELTDLTRNGNVGRFWQPSSHILGTPGAANSPGLPPVTVVINEFLANSSVVDWIELYNYGDLPVDLNGYYLTDNPTDPTKAQISASWSAGTTIIPARGYWVSNENDWGGFKLGSSGEQVYLIAPDGVTWVDGCDYGPQPIEDASQGRWRDGGNRWYKMLSTTPGAANQVPPSPVVINEIMYHPVGDSVKDPGAEYVEIHNTGVVAVDLTGWILNQGIDYVFPPGTTIPAGGYLVIAAQPAVVEGLHGITGVLGPYEGRLSNFSDDVELEDDLGNRVDFVEYRQERLWPEVADGEGPSLELANHDIDNRLPGAWRASVGDGTPGAANSQFLADPPATIDDVSHWPLVPTSSQTVTVTARIGAGNLTAATVYYKRDQASSFSGSLMYDDGQHGDGLAGDGVYGGVIQAFTSGSIVEFYIWAEATGGSRKFPPSSPTDNCLYIVQNAPDSNLTIFRFVMNDENWDWLSSHYTSDTPRDCTFIFADRAYYNSAVRFRGGTRDRIKKSYKAHLTPGYRFRGQDRFDLNFEKNDKTLLKNHVMYQFFNDMGLPGSRTEFIHTRWRSDYAGVHTYVEARGEDFLDNYFPGDSDGNLYKGILGWYSPTAWNQEHSASSIHYEKQTNVAENDWSDFIELGEVMENEPDVTYESEVRRLIDVPNWARTFAVWCVGCCVDSPWHFRNQNYRIYHKFWEDKWVHVIHDFDDAYWDTMYDNAGPFVSYYFSDVTRFLNWTAFTREYFHGIWRAINLTDGVHRESRIEPMLAYYHSLMYDDVAADPYAGSDVEDRWDEFQNGLGQWQEWITARNVLLRGWLPGATPLAITSPGGPTFVTGSPNLTLTGIAPISAPQVTVNWSQGGIEWDSVTDWHRDFVFQYRTNPLVVRTLDDDGNEIEQVSIEVIYTNGLDDAAGFTTDPLPVYSPLTVQFYDQSHASNITAWDWDFGDCDVGSGPNPTHTYPDGYQTTYEVTLTVTADGGPYGLVKPITVGLPPPPVPGDYDGDYDVDQDDFGRFQLCLTGTSSPQTDPACAGTDFDGDGFVTQDDLNVFLGCRSGPNLPGDPYCAVD